MGLKFEILTNYFFYSCIFHFRNALTSYQIQTSIYCFGRITCYMNRVKCSFCYHNASVFFKFSFMHASGTRNLWNSWKTRVNKMVWQPDYHEVFKTKSNLDMAVDYRVLFPGLDCESYRNCQNESLAVIGCRDHMTHYMGSNLHEMFHSSLFEN